MSKDQSLLQSSSHFKVSNFSSSQMGDLDLPRGAANYGDIPSGLYYNHVVVILVDTEIRAVWRDCHTVPYKSLRCVQRFSQVTPQTRSVYRGNVVTWLLAQAPYHIQL